MMGFRYGFLYLGNGNPFPQGSRGRLGGWFRFDENKKGLTQDSSVHTLRGVFQSLSPPPPPPCHFPLLVRGSITRLYGRHQFSSVHCQKLGNVEVQVKRSTPGVIYWNYMDVSNISMDNALGLGPGPGRTVRKRDPVWRLQGAF